MIGSVLGLTPTRVSWPDWPNGRVTPGFALRLAAQGFYLGVRDRLALNATPTIEGIAGVSGVRFPRYDESEGAYLRDVLAPAVAEILAQLPPCITRFTLPPTDPQSAYDILETTRLESLALAMRLEVRTAAETATLYVGFEGREDLP